MAKPTALVKCSSRFIDNPAVVTYVQRIERDYALRFVGGGGEQINERFKAEGWPINFGPAGRICETFEQRLAAQNVLEMNGAEFEDRLQAASVSAQIVVPVLNHEVGGVLCHINGDLLPIICYNGYNRFFVLTAKEDVERKMRFYAALWQICGKHLRDREMPVEFTLDANDLPRKITVVGF